MINPLIVKSMGVFLLAVSIKLVYISVISSSSLTSLDSAAYQSLAETLLNHHPYGSTSNTVQGGFPADLQRPPGYPLFIYLISRGKQISIFQIAVIQVILSSLLAAALCFSISKLINPQIGIISGIFYALDWVTIIQSPLLMADTLYTIAITACLIVLLYYFSCRKLYLILLGGVLLGIAALIKPTAQFILVPLLLILMIESRRSFINILLLLITYAVFTVPWMIRNYQKHEIFTLSSIGTVSLAFYVAEGVLASEKMTLTDTTALDERMAKKELYWHSLNVPPAERKKMMEEEAWTIIQSHWIIVIKQSLQGLIRTCVGTGTATFKAALAHNSGNFQPRLWGTILPLFQIILYWILAIYALFNMSKINDIDKTRLSLIVLMLIFSLLPSAMPLGNARFRTHAAPLLCILASIGVSSLMAQLKSFRNIDKTVPEIL